MRVTLVGTESGRRVHIADSLFPTRYTLCGARPASVITSDYEIRHDKPLPSDVGNICATCLRRAMADSKLGDW